MNSKFLSAGRGVAKLGVPPTGWTIIGLLFAFLSSLAYTRHSIAGQAAGGLLVLLSGFFDIIDGAVAKATGRVTKRGAFLDSTLDRLGEVALYIGIMIGGYSSPVLVLVAVTFSLLVSYTRARGDSLGANLSGIGIGERSERLILLALFSLVGFVYYGVIVVGVIAVLTFLQRTVAAWRALSN